MGTCVQCIESPLVLRFMQLEFRHLELLVALDEQAGLTEAAASINLSASAASRRLAEAERRLGAALVEPSGRSLSLSPSGRALAVAARSVFRELREAEFGARWLDHGAERRLGIGLGFHDQWSTLCSDEWLAELEIVRGADDQLVDRVRRGELDLVLDVHAEPSASVERLVDDELVAVVPADHELANSAAIAAHDLEAVTYLASSRDPKPGFEYERLFRPAAASPGRIIAIDSMTTILDLVAAGRGVTMQPAVAVAMHSLQADLVTLSLAEPIPVTWCAHVDANTDRRVGRLVEELRSRLTELAHR